MNPSPRRPRKWLQQAIDQLNPETDYVEIMSLVSNYQLDDFALNIAYVVNFMNVVTAPQGAAALMHTRKVVDHQQRRFTDSVDFLLTWYLLGPNHPIVQASVERLNRMHAAVAKGVPDSFNGNDDYLMALALVALFDHRLRLILGLPGLDDRMKTVYHHWLRDLSRLFTTGTETGRIDHVPPDWEGLKAFCEAFENRPYPPTDEGKAAAEALIQQFVDRWFPTRQLLGRTIILLFTPERVRQTHRLGNPHWLLGPLVKFGFKMAFLLKAHVLPDPQETILERMAKKGPLSPVLQKVLEAQRQPASPLGRPQQA